MRAVHIADAIAARLLVACPDYLIYRDFFPSDFQRPGFYLWTTKMQNTDLSLALVQRELVLSLEIFCRTDAYDEASSEELRAVAEQVQGLFAAPKTAVSNLDTGEQRFIEISAQGDGQEPDSAFMIFTARWVEARGADAPPTPPVPPPPLMEHVKLRVAAERKNHGNDKDK